MRYILGLLISAIVQAAALNLSYSRPRSVGLNDERRLYLLSRRGRPEPSGGGGVTRPLYIEMFSGY
jgi:hypothetical protein